MYGYSNISTEHSDPTKRAVEILLGPATDELPASSPSPRRVVAFIPLKAPFGGSRVGFDKEFSNLGGVPAMAYTVRAAIESDVFDDVIALTTSEEFAARAREWGASTPFYQPKQEGNWTDIVWVRDALEKLKLNSRYDAFAILRATSPFRSSDDIKQAWWVFSDNEFDSLRAVRPVSEHPGKMWLIRNGVMYPLLPMGPEQLPWHSRATQDIFDCYIQCGAMEFAWASTVLRTGTIAGASILPFVLNEISGFDINTREDWVRAEQIVESGKVSIPEK